MKKIKKIKKNGLVNKGTAFLYGELSDSRAVAYLRKVPLVVSSDFDWFYDFPEEEWKRQVQR